MEVENVDPPPPPARQPQQEPRKEGGPNDDGGKEAGADRGKTDDTGVLALEKGGIGHELVACAICCKTPQLSQQQSLSYCLKRTKNKTGVRHCPQLKVVPGKITPGGVSVDIHGCQALMVPGQRELVAAGEQASVKDGAVEVLRMTAANLVLRFMVPCEKCLSIGLEACMRQGHAQVKTLAELLPYSATPAPEPEPAQARQRLARFGSPPGQRCTKSRAVASEGGKVETPHASSADGPHGSSSKFTKLPFGDLSVYSERRKNIRGDFAVKDNMAAIVNDAWRIAAVKGRTMDRFTMLRAVRRLLSWNQGQARHVHWLMAARVLHVWLMNHPREEALLKVLVEKKIDKKFHFQLRGDGPTVVYSASELKIYDGEALFATNALHSSFMGENSFSLSPPVEQGTGAASSASSTGKSCGGGGSGPGGETESGATAPTATPRNTLAHIPAVNGLPSAELSPRRGRAEKRAAASSEEASSEEARSRMASGGVASSGVASSGSYPSKRVNSVPPCDNAASIGGWMASQSKRPQVKAAIFAKRRVLAGRVLAGPPLAGPPLAGSARVGSARAGSALAGPTLAGPARGGGFSQQEKEASMGVARSAFEAQAERAQSRRRPRVQQYPKVKVEGCEEYTTPLGQAEGEHKKQQGEVYRGADVEEPSTLEREGRSSSSSATVEDGVAVSNAAARRASWLLAVQENDRFLKLAQEAMGRAKEAHVARSSELMRWMVDEQSDKHNALGREGPPPMTKHEHDEQL